jgi:dephospho-CoA kinase
MVVAKPNDSPANKPLIVGLTGGIGSGKSLVADAFAKQGVAIVDADIVAREVVAPHTKGWQAIVDKFGTEVLQADNSLDRPALRTLAFAAPETTAWLNATLHPLIRAEMQQQLTAAEGPYVLFVVPLLIENSLNQWCDRICVVDVPTEMQLDRASQRDNNSYDQIQKIIQQQCSRSERLAKADDIIDNSKNISHTLKQVDNLHKLYKKFASGLNS